MQEHAEELGVFWVDELEKIKQRHRLIGQIRYTDALGVQTCSTSPNPTGFFCSRFLLVTLHKFLRSVFALITRDYNMRLQAFACYAGEFYALF